MEFGWDPEKDATTRTARGFGFGDVILVFDGGTLEVVDDRFDYGEVRVKATGVAYDRSFTVVYTDRGDVRWMISARLASRKERKAWNDKFG